MTLAAGEHLIGSGRDDSLFGMRRAARMGAYVPVSTVA
jgi:hypothetical protein